MKYGIWYYEFSRWVRESDRAERHPIGSGDALEFENGGDAELQASWFRCQAGNQFEVFELPAVAELETTNGERAGIAQCP